MKILGQNPRDTIISGFITMFLLGYLGVKMVTKMVGNLGFVTMFPLFPIQTWCFLELKPISRCAQGWGCRIPSNETLVECMDLMADSWAKMMAAKIAKMNSESLSTFRINKLQDIL